MTGGLGFLQVDGKTLDEPSGMSASFYLDLSGRTDDIDNTNLALSQFSEYFVNNKLEDLFQYSITGDAGLALGLETSVNGSTAIPSVSLDLIADIPLVNYGNMGNESEEMHFSFENIKLDLGSYMTNLLRPIVDGIDATLSPIYPIADALLQTRKSLGK